MNIGPLAPQLEQTVENAGCFGTKSGDIRLPKEITRLILATLMQNCKPEESVPTIRSIRGTSKSLHSLLIQELNALRFSFHSMGLTTAKQVTWFVEREKDQLTYIHTKGIDLSDEQLLELIKSSPKLEHLFVKFSSRDRDAEQRLAARNQPGPQIFLKTTPPPNLAQAFASFSGLKTLDISCFRIAKATLDVIISSDHFSSLTVLSLAHAKVVGPSEMEKFAASTTLSSLTDLNLADNKIRDAGIRALAASTTLTSLRSLDIRLCGISEEGAKAIANSIALKHLTSLKILSLWPKDKAERVKKLLQESLPMLETLEIK